MILTICFQVEFGKHHWLQIQLIHKNQGPTMNRFSELWISHAQEFLGLTNHLENKVCIYFNSWFSSRDYRPNISRRLNLKFTDNGFSKISQIGGGSSFDNTHFDGSNQTMGALNRQVYLTDSERQLLENTFSDDVFQELANRITVMNHV